MGLSLSQRPSTPSASNMTKQQFLDAVAATKEHIQVLRCGRVGGTGMEECALAVDGACWASGACWAYRGHRHAPLWAAHGEWEALGNRTFADAFRGVYISNISCRGRADTGCAGLWGVGAFQRQRRPRGGSPGGGGDGLWNRPHNVAR